MNCMVLVWAPVLTVKTQLTSILPTMRCGFNRIAKWPSMARSILLRGFSEVCRDEFERMRPMQF